MELSRTGSEPEEASDERSLYELREATAEEVDPEPPIEHPRALARNLERVVPVAQKQAVGGITVALTSLEFFGAGVGILHWRISHDSSSGSFMLEPDFEIRDGSGRLLPWSPGGASDREADGDVEVRSLPDAGELRVEVSRVASGAWDEEDGGPSYDGPWTFRFTI